jgi:aspartyl-tRNA(Asn)/glutamyl-tRNA(Gln) amidotransferase subunit C
MPSQVTPDEVARIAELARLEISADDGARLARQLTAILDYAASVQQVDTAGAVGAAAVPASWREDAIGHCLTREDALAAAPDAARELGLFRVPKVL